MELINSNNKRILLNTIYLYGRMLLLMLVSLFTVREIFNSLGVVDYGLYNVVGGVVVLFSFLSNTMLGASQRFFSYDIGKKDYTRLRRTFSVTITIYIVLSVFILLLAETVGLWFVNNKMNIPTERLNASNWVYQFSIISFIISIMTIPYTALLVAYERLKYYAFLGILEAVMKLVIVYLLLFFNVDRLVLYSGLLLFVSALNSVIYVIICRTKYKESKYTFVWDKNYFAELLSFSGWNLFGAFAGVLNNQGLNVLLNIFFGAIVNSARAIAIQINGVLNMFVSNLMLSVRPQITKYYAQGDKDNMLKLVCQSSKIGFFLLIFLSIPILVNTDYIISLWLGKVQDYVVIFVRITILTTLIDSISYPLMSAAQATGNIKKYQIIVGGFLLLNIPLSLLVYNLGYPPEWGLYVVLITSFICLILRLIILRDLIGLSIISFLKDVILRDLVVFAVSIVPILIISFYWDKSIMNFVCISALSCALTLTVIYLIGINTSERIYVNKFVISKISKS